MFEKIGQGKFEQISFILNYVESELVLEKKMLRCIACFNIIIHHELFVQCQDFEIDPKIHLINPNENEIYSFMFKTDDAM